MKNLFLLFTALFLGSYSHAQWLNPNPQPQKLTEKFFKDFEVDIPTPAFQKKQGFTTYPEMMNFLNDLVKKHPDRIDVKFIGESQKGLKIPIVELKNATTANDKVKVWIQAGLHGDEPASTEGVLYLIHELLTDPQYKSWFDQLTIKIVPMANIDGFQKQKRPAANGLDLNRDQTKLNIRESRYLKQAFSDFNAEVALDFHEYRPYRRDFVHFGEYGVTNLFDVMFLYSGNLNVPENLRDFTVNEFVTPAKEVLKKHGLRPYDYFTTAHYQGYTVFNLGSVHSRSSASSYALTNSISSLIEVRGVGLGRTSFKRRSTTTFLIAKSYLESAMLNSQEIKSVIAEAGQNKNPAVIRSKRKITHEDLPVIDVATNKEIEIPIILQNALQSSPELTRERPSAYILMPDQKELATRLEVLGLELKQLDHPVSTEVEEYTITQYHKDAEKFEGIFRQKVSAETNSITKNFPKGSYVVYMDQKNANLAVETLEPEADNSFVSFSVLSTAEGEHLPIYRYLKSSKLHRE